MLRRYPKIIAVLLLLVFSEKAGLRLWMHHWFHEGRNAASCTTPSGKILVACDCFNEAMLPLQGSPIFTIAVPIQKATDLGEIPQSPTPDTEIVYYSLKGPPAPPVCS